MLKPTVKILDEEIRYVAQSSGEPGLVWVLDSGSTSWESNKCTIASNPSGQVPLGVNRYYVTDLGSRELKNDHRLDQFTDQPITLITKGVVITDQIEGTPTAGATAYLGASGMVATETAAAGYGTVGTDVPAVGRFLSAKDSDGYCVVQIDL